MSIFFVETRTGFIWIWLPVKCKPYVAEVPLGSFAKMLRFLSSLRFLQATEAFDLKSPCHPSGWELRVT